MTGNCLRRAAHNRAGSGLCLARRPSAFLCRRALSFAHLPAPFALTAQDGCRTARARAPVRGRKPALRPVCPGHCSMLVFFFHAVSFRAFMPAPAPGFGRGRPVAKNCTGFRVGLVPPPNTAAVPVLAGRRPKAAWDRRCGAVYTSAAYPGRPAPNDSPADAVGTMPRMDAPASGFGLALRCHLGIVTGCRAAGGAAFALFFDAWPPPVLLTNTAAGGTGAVILMPVNTAAGGTERLPRCRSTPRRAGRSGYLDAGQHRGGRDGVVTSMPVNTAAGGGGAVTLMPVNIAAGNEKTR